MALRAVLPTELRRLSSFMSSALATDDGVVASVLPEPLLQGALASWRRLLPSLFWFGGRVRIYAEAQRGRTGATALLYAGRRPEWVVLLLAAGPGPECADAAFMLLSGVSALAARSGMQRIFAGVPDRGGARETFFQAGFYSYTRETWFVASAPPAPPRHGVARIAHSRDAHDLFRLYVATTPHAVQRAEQLAIEDFDGRRRAGAFDPPHVGGNPLAMRRQMLVIVDDERRPSACAISYRGADRHPHVCKVRTVDGEVDLARELVRRVAHPLRADRPVAVPVRSYEEHVARALALEGFSEAATAMLFVKELAVRIEEPAFAPAVVR
ncbi:hypothetical protein BH18CHL2_BH18CHL2_11040 [soil metagenome]